MSGSATLTIVTSMRSMKVATQTARSVQFFLLIGVPPGPFQRRLSARSSQASRLAVSITQR